MARGMFGTMMALQRAAATEQRRRDRENRLVENRILRQKVAASKVEKKLYVEMRMAEASSLNNDLQTQIHELDTLLQQGITSFILPDLRSLKRQVEAMPFKPGNLATPAIEPKKEDYLPKPLNFLGGLFSSKVKHEAAVKDGMKQYENADFVYRESEKDRIHKLEIARKEHAERVKVHQDHVAAHNKAVDRSIAKLQDGDPEAIKSYTEIVLTGSKYPESFPSEWRIAFVPESKQMVIEMDLPGLDVIPAVSAFKYVKTDDTIRETPRSATQVKQIYTSLVSSMTLRVLFEVFASDIHEHIDTVVLNGYVNTINVSTGQPIRPCLVTVRTTRDAFKAIDLSKVDPQMCLKGLNASVSKSPAELVPVRPVLEFNMVDKRFIAEEDVISTLDQRPNLMELSPSEFESLITNLFEKMGLETRLTVASRDGGVDCVAFDPRPIFGGKVVIQAKRYKNTVGVSAVRDLFGTMQNEGASKGILVTTSGYGKASFEFADGKPIELLSGSNLLFLLAEHAGLEAKIEPPDDWKDPSTNDF